MTEEDAHHIILQENDDHSWVEIPIVPELLDNMRNSDDSYMIVQASEFTRMIALAESHQLLLRAIVKCPNDDKGGATIEYTFQSPDASDKELDVDESVVLSIECAAALCEFGRQKRFGHEAVITDITDQLPSLQNTGVHSYVYLDISDDLMTVQRTIVLLGKNGLLLTSYDSMKHELYPEWKNAPAGLLKELKEWVTSHWKIG